MLRAYYTVGRTTTQATRSTLRTLDVEVLPLLMTAELAVPAWVCPTRQLCPPSCYSSGLRGVAQFLT